jgi:homogentisate 1,2-dioxygenase
MNRQLFQDWKRLTSLTCTRGFRDSIDLPQPWYYMNGISEFMGLIRPACEAKPQGYVPGGFSLHNTTPPHGPDKDAFEGASNAALKLHKLEGAMAFIFETRFPQRVTAAAAGVEQLQKTYGGYGSALIRRFDPTRP